MDGNLKVPVLSYEQIRKSANSFLEQFNPKATIPVPIEEIVEFRFGINIIPIPGLQRLTDVDGFISSDFKSISVDQFIMEQRESRYRYTLAHELGHVWLHRGVFANSNFDTIESWKNFQVAFGEEEYGWLEYQGYSFGGLVLVPMEPLAEKLAHFEKLIQREGLDPKTEAAQLILVRRLADEFNVSCGVIEKRLVKDGLRASL